LPDADRQPMRAVAPYAPVGGVSMPKTMLINVTHSEESRVGILDNGVLESFEIESLSREHLKGNIYKGTVHRIHPALEAAFVDIGAERDAFLPLDEICFRNLAVPPPPPTGENGKRRRRIRDILKPGEEVLVQIAKEQFANKPPTLTTFYSLPGRYLVLLPGSDETTGISRRIEGEERQRLRQLVSDLNPPEGFGLIVRTAAGLDEDTAELSRDLTYLQRLWESVLEAARHKRAPALVYREHDIVLRTIRDFFTPDIDEIHIDNEDVYQRAREFLQNVMPGREHVLHCYQGEQPIFSAFDVETQIESVFKRRVPLRSGGTIVVDGTEALTAIDVNSGGSVRGPNPEETAFRTNVEAATEVARQLRLRDIGGLIVVDFIDMRDPRHIQEVERTLRESMKPDKARHEVGRISRLGLLEISRQRLRPAVMGTSYTTCPMCEGHGAVRTTESAALVALRKIHNRVSLGDVASLRVALPTAVAMYLLNHKRDDLARLEERYQSRLLVERNDALMPHQVEIEARERPRTEPVASVPHGGVAQADTPAPAANGNGAAAGEAPGKKKRRRRGRRRGSGLRAAAAIGEALAALGGSAHVESGAGAAADAEPDARPIDSGAALPGAPDAVAAASSVAPAADFDAVAPVAAADTVAASAQPTTAPNERPRRGRRGGRRHRSERAERIAAIPTAVSAPQAPAIETPDAAAGSGDIADAEPAVAVTAAAGTATDGPMPPRRRSTARRPRARTGTTMPPSTDTTTAASTDPAPAKTRGSTRRTTRTRRTDAEESAPKPATKRTRSPRKRS
jgi:ribonuclease E